MLSKRAIPNEEETEVRKIILGVPLLWVGSALALAQSPSVDRYQPKVVLRKALPAITQAPVVSMVDANVADHELVIGVVIDGVARAYPINQLTGPRREIINDELNGTAIAATW